MVPLSKDNIELKLLCTHLLNWKWWKWSTNVCIQIKTRFDNLNLIMQRFWNIETTRIRILVNCHTNRKRKLRNWARALPFNWPLQVLRSNNIYQKCFKQQPKCSGDEENELWLQEKMTTNMVQPKLNISTKYILIIQIH